MDLSPFQAKVQQLLSTWYHVHVTSFDAYQSLAEKFDEGKLRTLVLTTPIEEVTKSILIK